MNRTEIFTIEELESVVRNKRVEKCDIKFNIDNSNVLRVFKYTYVECVFFEEIYSTDQNYSDLFCFDRCCFRSSIYIRSCIFPNQIIYDDCAFLNKIKLTLCVFQEELQIMKCEFNNQLLVNECGFYSDYSFKDCRFYDYLRFDTCSFYDSCNDSFISDCHLKRIVLCKCELATEFKFGIICGSSIDEVVIDQNKSIFDFIVYRSNINYCVVRNNTIESSLFFDLCEFRKEINFDCNEYLCKINFDSCKFIEPLILYDIVFQKKLSFYQCEFQDCLVVKNSIFDSTVSFWNSIFLDKIQFDRVDFNQVFVFTISTCNNEVQFLNSSVRSNTVINFSGTEFKSGLDISRANFNCTFNCWNISIRDIRKNNNRFKLISSDEIQYNNDVDMIVVWRRQRETFRIIKNALESQGNKVDALEFRSKEMRCYWNELSLANNPGRVLMLSMNRLSNNFGVSWGLGIVWIFSVSIIFYFFFIVSLDGDIVVDFTYLSQNVSDIFNMWQVNKLGQLEGYPNISASTQFILIIGRILIGYGIYQTIQAFRKYGK